MVVVCVMTDPAAAPAGKAGAAVTGCGKDAGGGRTMRMLSGHAKESGADAAMDGGWQFLPGTPEITGPPGRARPACFRRPPVPR